MRKFYSAIMALTVLLFASCDKNEGDIGTTDDGVQAKMGLTISFPLTTTKVANDGNATELEATPSSIIVFIFENDGLNAEGSPAIFDGDLTEFFDVTTVGANKYVLKDEHLIETTTGTKRIYAGVNLPAFLDGVNVEYITEDKLIAAASTTGLLSPDNVWVTKTTSSKVAMLSKAASKNLAAYEEEDDNINKVTLTVERLMSKIAVTNYTSDDYTNTDREGGKFTLIPDAFTVGNIPIKIYPVQRIVSSKLVTPGLEVNGSGKPIPTAPLLPSSGILAENMNEEGTGSTDLNAFYVPEHAPSNSRYDATYAVVRATFTFEELASVEDDEIVLTTDGSGTSYSKNKVWVVQNGIYTYFCETKEEADKVKGVLSVANIYEYHRSSLPGEDNFYTFYYVFINNDKFEGDYSNSDRLALYRNQFYNILVNDVKGMGVPGNNDDDEPYNPPLTPPVIDDNDPDPVYEEMAMLRVTIDVQKWDYRAPEVILEPLK